MIETSSGLIPCTAEDTRNFNALAWVGESPPEAVVTVTEAVGWFSLRKDCPEGAAICTRAARIIGLATIVRASSPSFARQ